MWTAVEGFGFKAGKVFEPGMGVGNFAGRTWIKTEKVTLPGPDGKPVDGHMNSYFAEHPEMVLVEQGFFDKLYKGRYAVRAPKGYDFKAELTKAIGKLPRDVMTAWSEATDHEIEFTTEEKKEGTFYLAGGKLMQ